MLEVINLQKSYGEFNIENLNLSIDKGEIVGFIGENGAGKSTVIKSILNIIDFDSGNILFNGKNVSENEVNVKLEIGYVGENNNVYNDITLKKLYRFLKNSYKNRWDDSFFNELAITKFKLDLNKKMKELSKGMVVKFMIASALAHNPKFLILDEPTSGLDPVIRQEVLNILIDLNKTKKTTIFMSSHITEDIDCICNRIIYIDNGKIILDSYKRDITPRYGKIRVEQVLADKKDLIKKISVINNGYYYFENQDLKNLFKYNDIEKISLSEVLLFLKGRENFNI